MKKCSFFLLLFCAIFATGLHAQQVVKDFVNKQQQQATRDKIIIVAPQTILHTNANIASMPGFEKLDADQQDTLIKKYTKVLDKINDDKVKQQLLNDLTYELERLGLWVEIRSEKPDAVFPQEHVIDISVVEIQETQMSYVDTLREGNRIYPFQIPFSTLDFYLWFTLIENPDKEFNNLFQKRNQTEFIDFHEAKVENNGSLTLSYTLYPISANEVYSMAHQTAVKMAHNIYRYLLNKYVLEASDGENTHCYTVNRKTLIIEECEFPSKQLENGKYNLLYILSDTE